MPETPSTANDTPVVDVTDEPSTLNPTDGIPRRDSGAQAVAAGQDDSAPADDTFPRAYVEKLRAEAAEHRVRAKRADDLAARLLETTVRSAAASILADPADLLLHTDDADLVDDDGFPDADRIIEAAKTLVATKPHLATRRPTGDIDQGTRGTTGTVNLADMLRTRA